MRISQTLMRLQDTTAEIRIRGAFLLMTGFVVLAARLGLEVILGAFIGGVILRLIDRDRTMTHPQFHLKLEAVGYGVFIPVFFVTSGLQFDLTALFANTSALLRIPLFLLALLAVRGLPAIIYRSRISNRLIVVAGLLQATSLPIIVAAAQIGISLGLLSKATSAALVSAGLFSVILFPLIASIILRSGQHVSIPVQEQQA